MSYSRQKLVQEGVTDFVSEIKREKYTLILKYWRR